MGGFAFVDDTDLIVTDALNDEEAVASKMQGSVSLWHGLLKATGGDLVPEKCFWYLIDFQFEHHQWKFKQWPETQCTIHIPREDGTRVTISHLHMMEAHQTLGVRLAPDGNNEEEHKYLLGISQTWKQHMAVAFLLWVAVEFSLQQVLLPKLSYPLIVTTFMEKQCEMLLKLVLTQGLPAMGINQNFPRVVAHGPLAYQGLNLPNLFTEQLITHIRTLVKYGSHPDDVMGNLIRANVELLQLETSMRGPLFQILPLFQVCITPTWVSQCWVHCAQYGIDISTDLPDLKPHCERDKEIMRIFAEGGYRSADLALLNCCCMNLHIIFLSDICNGSGSCIEQKYWCKEQPANIYPYIWPMPAKLSTSDWNFWRKSLQLSLNLGHQQCLPLPLGCWYHEESQIEGWYTDSTGEHLYHLTLTGWASFTPIPAWQHKCTFHDIPRAMALEDIPNRLEKVMVYLCGQIVTITGSGPIDYSQLVEQQMSLTEFWMSQHCDYCIQGSAQELKEAILQGVAVAISNGSYQLEAGAAVWTVEGHTSDNWILGAGTMPGMDMDHSAYRSKLFGLWGILMSLYHFTKEHQIENSHVTVACNGLSALCKAQATYLTEPSKAHYNLISVI